MMDVTMLGVITTMAVWSLVYVTLCHVMPGRSAEWHCREVTVVHALTVLVLSTWSIFVQGPWPFTDPGGPNTPLQHWTCLICLGYFIFDLIWCVYYKTEGPLMLFHHSLSIFGMSVGLYYGIYGTELVATIFGTELTNPFLQLRWFMRQTGLRDTWLYEINDVIFMALFGFLRTVVASNLLYCYMRHPRPDSLGRVGAVLIYLVGWGFWVMILRYAFRKYRKIFDERKWRIRVAEKSSSGDAVANGSDNGKDAVTRPHLLKGKGGVASELKHRALVGHVTDGREVPEPANCLVANGSTEHEYSSLDVLDIKKSL